MNIYELSLCISMSSGNFIIKYYSSSNVFTYLTINYRKGIQRVQSDEGFSFRSSSVQMPVSPATLSDTNYFQRGFSRVTSRTDNHRSSQVNLKSQTKIKYIDIECIGEY